MSSYATAPDTDAILCVTNAGLLTTCLTVGVAVNHPVAVLPLIEAMYEPLKTLNLRSYIWRLLQVKHKMRTAILVACSGVNVAVHPIAFGVKPV